MLEIDGRDFDQIDRAIRKATKLSGKPGLIICKTHIGKGSPNKQDSPATAHPSAKRKSKLTKRALGLPEDQLFYILGKSPSSSRSAPRR